MTEDNICLENGENASLVRRLKIAHFVVLAPSFVFIRRSKEEHVL